MSEEPNYHGDGEKRLTGGELHEQQTDPFSKYDMYHPEGITIKTGIIKTRKGG